jgi:hypothetical protein
VMPVGGRLENEVELPADDAAGHPVPRRARDARA